jgi:hypothetical protein
MSNTPPERPWKKGQQDGYTCFSVEIVVCADDKGAVWSEHRLGQDDAVLSQTLQGGGARQIAHALLVEAIRREVFVDVLVELSKKNGYLERYQAADEAGKRGIERDLSNAGLAVLVGVLPKLLPGTAREVLEMVSGKQPA